MLAPGSRRIDHYCRRAAPNREPLPVTLYTVLWLRGLRRARDLLRKRGILHAERRVLSREGFRCLQKLTGGRERRCWRSSGRSSSRPDPDTWNSNSTRRLSARMRLPARLCLRCAVTADRAVRHCRRLAPKPAEPPAKLRRRRVRSGSDRHRCTRRAGQLPAPGPPPISQNSAEAPTIAPSALNSSGISALEKLIVIRAQRDRLPWRSGGVSLQRGHDHRADRRPAPAQRGGQQHRPGGVRERVGREDAGSWHAAGQHLPFAQVLRDQRMAIAAPPPPPPANTPSTRPDRPRPKPRSWPSTGYVPARGEQPVHRQQPARPGVRRSQARAGTASAQPGASFGTRRAHSSAPSGRHHGVGGAKAARSISAPASTGPITLASAGARPSQLNPTRLSAVGSVAYGGWRAGSRSGRRWHRRRPASRPRNIAGKVRSSAPR